jgi:hypothetical protein
MALLGILLGFLISLVVSSIVIYVAAKLFGEKEGFGTAILAALAGAIIFELVSYILGIGLIAALIGGIVWLIALGSLYQIGWLKSLLITIVIWVFASIVSLVLPTVIGPL